MHAAVDAAPVARATPDGGFVIGWSARAGSLQDLAAVYVARFASNGASVGGPVAVSASAGEQSAAGVNPLADGTVVVTWREAAGFGSSGHARTFDPSGQPSGPARQIVAAAGASSAFASAPLAGNRVAVAWGSLGTQLNWQVLDASGAPLGNPASLAGTGELTRVGVVDAGDGFHVLYQNAEQSPRSNASTLSVQRVDAGGAPDGASSVIVRRRLVGLLAATGAPAPTASPEFSASGGADGHYAVSYQVSADTSVEVHAESR